jgi:Holliday junction DNA helicase RuvA
MYYIKGKVQQPNTQDFLVIENNNIGYKIFTNEKAEIDQEISLFINVVFNEEEIIYSGFKEQIELEVFQLLISINGIGVKTALKILKHTNYKKLIYF